MNSLILVSNPGSASRKYALFRGMKGLASLHFEHQGGRIVCSLISGGQSKQINTEITKLTDAALGLNQILLSENLLKESEEISLVGLRVVSPGSYFLEDRVFDDEMNRQLKKMEPRAPLHISATLSEFETLKNEFSGAKIIGVSDSAFHITKPEYAWNYGISLNDADTFDIKRFGYHGLSVSSAVNKLAEAHRLPNRLLVCHMGSGISISAVYKGKSFDTTMGYSPLEGTIMATRSGSIDYTAVRALRDSLGLDDRGVEVYLNHHAGLLGLGGASGVLELLEREKSSDHIAKLALDTYVHSLVKSVGQMAAALGGADTLVFTGTVGERSAPIRQRVIEKLHFLDFALDNHDNEAAPESENITRISKLLKSKPIFIIKTDEAAEIARHVLAIK